MEKEMNQEPEAQVTEEAVVETPAAPAEETPIGKKVCSFFEGIKNQISIGEVILFVAAYIGVGLIDLISKNMQSPMAASGTFAFGVVATFGLAFWMSKGGIRPISTFLYSTAAIGALMLTVTLVPTLLGKLGDITLISIVSVIILTIGLIYLVIAKHIKNTGSSFILGAIASFGFAVFIAAQLSNIPCGNAFANGAENAATICQITPYVQNILILVPLFALGYFGMMPKK